MDKILKFMLFFTLSFIAEIFVKKFILKKDNITIFSFSKKTKNKNGEMVEKNFTINI